MSARRWPSRRWLIVAALFAVTYGISTPLAAYGVFLPILAEAFGWSRGAIAAALSVNLLIGGLAGFVIGGLADRHGPRIMLVATVAMAGAAFALVGTVSALWHLYLFVGLLGGIGMSSFYLLGAATVAHWFVTKRGLALALVLVGFNLCYVTGGPLAAWLIDGYGWRAAYAILGGGCGLLTMLAALTIRLPRVGEVGPRSQTVSHGPSAAMEATLRDALRDPRQWLLNASWLCMGGLALMVNVHIVPFARDAGIGLAGASLALTAYGIGAAGGRLLGGVISDRFGAISTQRLAFLITALSLLVLRWAPSHAALLGSMAAFGAGFAATDTLVVKIVPDLFGVRAIGAIMGVLTLGWRSGAALGPAAAGFLYDATGSYAWPFGLAPAVALTSWACFALALRWPVSSRARGRPR
jgi:MFS transporter, OFA family, oxalate/formate antiporter